MIVFFALKGSKLLIIIHKLIGRSLEILNLLTVFKNHEPVHVKLEKCIFVPQVEYSRMRTTKLKFDDAER